LSKMAPPAGLEPATY